MTSVAHKTRSLEEARAELVERLRTRAPELGEAVFVHVRSAVADSAGEMDAQFIPGMHQAALACVDCAIMAIAQGEEWCGPVPPTVVVQARRAARGGVSLATGLCRYVAGYALIWDAVLEEAGCSKVADAHKVMLLRSASIATTSLLTRIVVEVTRAHACELERSRHTRKQRRTDLVRRLLAGKLLEASELEYDLNVEHTGLVAFGADAEKAVEVLAERLGCKLLLVAPDDGTLWAWLGGRPRCAAAGIPRQLLDDTPQELTLAIGEPEFGVAGFRNTHRLAQSAFKVAQRKPQRITRYADVALEAQALADDTHARGLVTAYLSPLDRVRDRAVLLRALHAFYDARRNESGAARVLGVGRQTVMRRLRRIEQLIGRPLYTCHAEIEVALRLEQIVEPSAAPHR